MAQPPSSPLIPFDLTRNIPPISQKTFNYSGAVGQHLKLGPGDTMIVAFDTGITVTDPAQFLSPATNPSADATPGVVGRMLDALWTSDQIGTVDIAIAVDYSCPYDSIVTIGIVAGITDNISGFRITGRFVRIVLTNTSGVASNTRFGVYLGTN